MERYQYNQREGIISPPEFAFPGDSKTRRCGFPYCGYRPVLLKDSVSDRGGKIQAYMARSIFLDIRGHKKYMKSLHRTSHSITLEDTLINSCIVTPAHAGQKRMAR